MKQTLQVLWHDGRPVGHIVNRGTHFFEYDPQWLTYGHSLSPVKLPFASGVAWSRARSDGLPGVFVDCLPDAWGLKVAQREFRRRGWGNPTAMTLLAWRGLGGIGALSFYPELHTTRMLERVSAGALAKGARNIERNLPDEVLRQLALSGSAGGAQPKALVLAYPDGTLKVGGRDDKGQLSILKLDLSAFSDTAKIEKAYLEMASSAGIDVPDSSLIGGLKDGEQHLLVKRFDISAEGKPLHFLSLSGLLEREPTGLDYADFFRAALQLKCSRGDLSRIARRMVFNVLASNMDDHGRNHAFIYDEASRAWALSPAYDLTFSQGMLERGLSVGGEVLPNIGVMRKMCADVGVGGDDFEEMLSATLKSLANWKNVAGEVGLRQEKIIEVSDRFKEIHRITGAGGGRKNSVSLLSKREGVEFLNIPTPRRSEFKK